MKSLRFALLLSLVSASAFAQGFAVVPKISTLGYGADFIIGLSRSAQLRLGAQTGSITHELEESGAVYDGEADLSGQNLMLDLFPAGGSFRFSIGAIRNENEFSGQTNEDSLVELNGNFYPVRWSDRCARQ